MKRKTLIHIAALLLVSLLLAGCGENQRLKKAEIVAEDYLSALMVQVADETLHFTDADVERFGEIIAFPVYSEKYGEDFRINVNADNTVTDSYFALSLRDITGNELSYLMGHVLPDRNLDFELSLNRNIVSSALSGRTFRSVREAYEAVGGAIELIRVDLFSVIPEEELAQLLTAIQEKGFYGEFCMTGDVRVFHISEGEITYTRTDDPPGEVRFYAYPASGNM